MTTSTRTRFLERMLPPDAILNVILPDGTVKVFQGDQPMRVRYVNRQDKSDPMNGAVMADADKLAELLEGRRKRAPFIADLTGDNGFELMIGLGGELGCAQYSQADGEPPYLMAVSPHLPPIRAGYVEFLAASTPTPLAARYIISFDELKQVACHFLDTGGRSDVVSWQEFHPAAAREDAHRASRSRNRTE